MFSFPLKLSSYGEKRLLDIFEAAFARDTEQYQALHQKLDQINQKLGGLGAIVVQITELHKTQEELKNIMANQAERLQAAINSFGTKLDTGLTTLKEVIVSEAAEVKAEIEKLKGDNPEIEASIAAPDAKASEAEANITAAVDSVRGIIVTEPVVESVSNG